MYAVWLFAFSVVRKWRQTHAAPAWPYFLIQFYNLIRPLASISLSTLYSLCHLLFIYTFYMSKDYVIQCVLIATPNGYNTPAGRHFSVYIYVIMWSDGMSGEGKAKRKMRKLSNSNLYASAHAIYVGICRVFFSSPF